MQQPMYQPVHLRVPEQVLDIKYVNGTRMVLLKWKDYDSSENAWIPEKDVACQQLVCAYLKRNMRIDGMEPRPTFSAAGIPNRHPSLNVAIRHRNGRRELVPFHQAAYDFPQHVVVFLERKLKWAHDGHPNACDRELERIRSHTGCGGIQLDYHPESIKGVLKTSRGLFVLIKWQGVPVFEVLPASEIHKRYPHMLIHYYYNRILCARCRQHMEAHDIYE